MIMNNAAEFINTTQSFDNLLEKANAIQARCEDFKVAAGSITMGQDMHMLFGDKNIVMSDFARGELCGKLSIPSRYITRCIESNNTMLAAENMNYWLQNDKRNLLIRNYDGACRGVLSGSYSAYDAPEILTTLAEVFDPATFVLKGSFINEERLHLRMIDKNLLDIEDEDLYAGITLDSSDIGRSGLSVKFFIWKQVCTNGLVIAKSAAKMFRQKHIGITHDDFAEGLQGGLKKFDDLKEKIAESIRETSKIPADKDLESLIEEIKNTTNLSDQAAEKVVELMEVKYAPTRWGLINGITEVAQDFTLETRLRLEEIAGNMLV